MHPNNYHYCKDTMETSKFVEFAMHSEALQFGKFTLKSGRISPYFFNAGKFNSGEHLAVLSEFYAQRLIDSGIEFDMLFGPAYKGIPLATAISILALPFLKYIFVGTSVKPSLCIFPINLLISFLFNKSFLSSIGL